MSALSDAYMRHRAQRLTHKQAIRAIAVDTGLPMADVLATLNRQDALNRKDGVAPRNWRKPRLRTLKHAGKTQ